VTIDAREQMEATWRKVEGKLAKDGEDVEKVGRRKMLKKRSGNTVKEDSRNGKYLENGQTTKNICASVEKSGRKTRKGDGNVCKKMT